MKGRMAQNHLMVCSQQKSPSNQVILVHKWVLFLETCPQIQSEHYRLFSLETNLLQVFYEIRFHFLLDLQHDSVLFRQCCDLAAWTRTQTQPQEWDELSGFIRRAAENGGVVSRPLWPRGKRARSAGAGWMNQEAGERAGCWWAGEEAGRWVMRRIVISQEYKTTNKLLRTVKHKETARELRPLQQKQLVMEYFLYNIITFTRVGTILVRGCWIICIQDELLIVHKGTNNKQTNKQTLLLWAEIFKRHTLYTRRRMKFASHVWSLCWSRGGKRHGRIFHFLRIDKGRTWSGADLWKPCDSAETGQSRRNIYISLTGIIPGSYSFWQFSVLVVECKIIFEELLLHRSRFSVKHENYSMNISSY